MPRDPVEYSGPALRRLPLVALGMVGLVAALWTGLARAGWALPLSRADLALAHGPLMVGGFLGTVIGLERAVALGRAWGYVSPMAAALSVVALLIGAPAPVAPLLVLLSSVVLLAMFARFIQLQSSLATIVMAAAVVAWCEGNLLWLVGRPFFEVVYWWIGFLVLTIVGERLQLSRIAVRSRASSATFVAGIVVVAAGLGVSRWGTAGSERVLGAGLVVLSYWMLRYDIARKTARQTGLSRFIGLCLLSGAVWLGVGGVLFGAFGRQVAGVRYDAAVHAVMVGFVFSMIFGHAPLIFPAVLNAKMSYRRIFYGHLVLLHASLALRIVADLVGSLDGRRIGGLANAVAIVWFVVNTVGAVVSARRA